MPHPLAEDLRDLLSMHADPANAAPMQAYMKDVAPFFGVKTPERRALLKAFTSLHPASKIDRLDELARDCFAFPERELHYCAVELLQQAHKTWDGTELPLFETLLHAKPWWDTVDTIAVKLAGPWMLRFPERRVPTIHRWMRDPHKWSRRTAIIFQNAYKSRTDAPLLFEAIRANAADPDFFLRKGIGWALREYAKTNPDAVRDFVDAEPLSGLSRREALKHL